jgi:histidinol-phosphate aminotransferase
MTTSLAAHLDQSMMSTAVPLPLFVAGSGYGEASTRLSLSENGMGCSPRARQAAVDETGRLHRYPDATALRLIAAIARREVVTPDHVVAGNGIDELLLVSALALIGSTSGVVSASTYPGHANAVRAARRDPIVVPLRDLRVDVDAKIDVMRPGVVVYVCNPHNPTGTALLGSEIETLAAAAAERGAVLVVDEAYIEFAHAGETRSAVDHVRAGLPVIVLRTFSKVHGLAGLRCGYALAPPALCNELRRLKSVLVFNVNRVALAAAEASLLDAEFTASVQARTRTAIREFEAWLSARPWARVGRSVTNFTLVELPWPACTVAAELARRGVLVRDCTDLGLLNHVRISAGDSEDMDTARTALDDVARELGAACGDRW